VQRVINENPAQLKQYREGKLQLFGFFVGKVMKESKGKAPGNLVQKLLKEELERN
ncbi:MAG: Asp-tRNA(Asn)/Glu-tRNA(Gln) amidotransferase GatCAB subunit B, partial [Caldisericia bacterium]|nr:Asp-tRNA(Asn)/Glu-tRNA(Gln) amidotransferase GatCAB subunit B [Caldisericia bacterium]